MASKTLIDGTAYEIKGGKTMLDGSVYEIKGSKTLVDNTVYEIGFEKICTVTIGAYQSLSHSSHANYAAATINGQTYDGKTNVSVDVLGP